MAEVVTLQDMKNILAKFYSNDSNTIRYAHNRTSIGATDPTVTSGMVYNVMRLFAGAVYNASPFQLLFKDKNCENSKDVSTNFGGALGNVTGIPIGKRWKDYMREYLVLTIEHWNSPIYQELMEQYDQAANGFQMRRALYDIFSEVVHIREQGSQPTPPTPTIRTVTLAGGTDCQWDGPSTIADGSQLSGNLFVQEGRIITNIVVSGGAQATYSGLSTRLYRINSLTVSGANVVITPTVQDSPGPTPADYETITITPTTITPSNTNNVYTPLEISFSTIAGTELECIIITTNERGSTVQEIKSMRLQKENGVWKAVSCVTMLGVENNKNVSIVSTTSGFRTEYIGTDEGKNNLGLGINRAASGVQDQNRAAVLGLHTYTITGYNYIPTT